MQLFESVADTIGHTPLVDLARFAALSGAKERIWGKLESRNPGGSVKDRVARSMVDASGLQAGATIIEPTSGNTGIGLALVCAARGMRLILTMPETMSIERRGLLAALGAELILTPAGEGMRGAVERAESLRTEIAGAVVLGQFDNPANPLAHYQTTAPEIWTSTAGAFDAFVAGVGTGGTVSGVGRFLKEHNPAIEVVAVEPAESPILSGGVAGPHKIQGIGANFVPKNFDRSVVDRIAPVNAQEAMAAARLIARTEGLLVGISSGAALHAAAQIASTGQTVVVVLPDTGERYLSTQLFGQ